MFRSQKKNKYVVDGKKCNNRLLITLFDISLKICNIETTVIFFPAIYWLLFDNLIIVRQGKVYGNTAKCQYMEL